MRHALLMNEARRPSLDGSLASSAPPPRAARLLSRTRLWGTLQCMQRRLSSVCISEVAQPIHIGGVCAACNIKLSS